jgi:hypothetical protein
MEKEFSSCQQKKEIFTMSFGAAQIESTQFDQSAHMILSTAQFFRKPISVAQVQCNLFIDDLFQNYTDA